MEATAIALALTNRQKGSFYTIEMQRPAKTFKTYSGAVIEKHSTLQGILCDYANRSPVKNAVADGMRDEPELPSHIQTAFSIGNVKFWLGKNGKTYLAVCATGNEPKVQWYLGGQPVRKSDVEQYLLASEKQKPAEKEETEDKGQAVFFGIDVTNILAVR